MKTAASAKFPRTKACFKSWRFLRQSWGTMIAAAKPAFRAIPFVPNCPLGEASNPFPSLKPQELAASTLVAATAEIMLAIHTRLMNRSCESSTDITVVFGTMAVEYWPTLLPSASRNDARSWPGCLIDWAELIAALLNDNDIATPMATSTLMVLPGIAKAITGIIGGTAA